MKFTESMIGWTPNSDKIEVGPWPDTTGWSDKHPMTSGACNSSVHRMDEFQLVAHLFIEFNKIVVRDGVDPSAAHDAFLTINEYRYFIAPDMKGAEDHPGENN